MAKHKKKQKIRIFFRDGKKDVVPQKFWDDYEVLAKDSGMYLVIIKNEQWIAGYNLRDVTAWTVG
jgi:hypothetical protein